MRNGIHAHTYTYASTSMCYIYLVNTQPSFPPPPSLNKGAIIKAKNHKITRKSRLKGNSGDLNVQL